MISYQVDLVNERSFDENESRGCCRNSNALCGDTTMTINRDLPPAIENTDGLHPTSSFWKDFCDKIDAALIPLAKLKRRNARYALYLSIISLCIFMAAPCVAYLAIRHGENDSTSADNSNSAGSGDFDSSEDADADADAEHENNPQGDIHMNMGVSVWPRAIIIGLLMLPLLGLCYLASSGKVRDGVVCNELDKICREASGPNIQFLFMREIVYTGGPKSRARVRKYIELRIEGMHDIEAFPRDRTQLQHERPSTPDTFCSIESIKE
jgi:hypothetical protein